jgi:hypothetical protein
MGADGGPFRKRFGTGHADDLMLTFNSMCFFRFNGTSFVRFPKQRRALPDCKRHNRCDDSLSEVGHASNYPPATSLTKGKF